MPGYDVLRCVNTGIKMSTEHKVLVKSIVFRLLSSTTIIRIRLKMKTMAKRLVFIGRVQGVGFRYTAHRMARRYEITGFVRNLPDRTVEMLAQGPESDIANCLEEIQEYFGRSIREIKATEITPDPRYTDFRIRY